MKCTNCGYETQATAKFCVQCGTTLPAVASPAAAGTATVISAAPKAAAAAPSLAPAPAPASPSTTQRLAAATYAPTPSPTAAPAAQGVPTPAAPRRLGLIAGMVALVAVLCVGGFMAYRMLFSDDSKPSVATTEPKAAEGSATQPADASKDGRTPGAAQPPAGPDNNMSTPEPPAGASTPDNSKTTPATVGAAPSPGGTTSKAGAAAAPKVDPAAASKTATPPPSASPAPATPPRQTAAATTAPAAQADHWEQMRQAYEVCNRESLFDRLACNQRVGREYCKGNWGLVPQCPAGQYGDRGNQ